MANNLLKWKHSQSDIILLCVRWYLKYPLSYRNLVEMLSERGLSVSHTTIMRWVIQYSPILDQRVRKHLHKTNDSWRLDETYLKIKGINHYLYRAVDSEKKPLISGCLSIVTRIPPASFFRKHCDPSTTRCPG